MNYYAILDSAYNYLESMMCEIVHLCRILIVFAVSYLYHNIIQIPGYKYMCELRDPSGLSIVTKSIPINESQAICQIEQNQVCGIHVYQ